MSIDILDEIKNEEGKQDIRIKIGKDYSGAAIKLTLIKKQECKGKDYDLYKVCKVIDNGVGKREFIHLYDETFTDQQVEKFYTSKSRFHSEEENENEEEEELEKETTTCAWCGEKNIPVKELSNARGFGFYGVCPVCNKETVVEEIDCTRTI